MNQKKILIVNPVPTAKTKTLKLCKKKRDFSRNFEKSARKNILTKFPNIPKTVEVALRRSNELIEHVLVVLAEQEVHVFGIR